MGWNVLLFYTVYICLDAFCSEKFKKVFSPCCMILICIIVIALDFFIVLRMNKLNSDVKTMKADIYGTERK